MCGAAPISEQPQERLQSLIARTRSAIATLAQWLEETAEQTLTFLTHTQSKHRRLLKTTNGMEHDDAEVRRRTRVVRMFPNESSLVRLLGALAIERYWQWLERRYMMFWDGPTTESNSRAVRERPLARSSIYR